MTIIKPYFPDIDSFSHRSTSWKDLENKGELLYTAYVLPDEDILCAKFGEAISEKIAYRILDGGETWVVAGKPVFIPMNDLYTEGEIIPSSEIRAQSSDYNFGYLKIVCGFGGHTGSPHPMIEGRMTVSLITNPSNTEEPMVYGWTPKDTMDQQKIIKEYSISPSFDFIPLNGNYKKHVEFTQLQPVITVNGGQTSIITWDYYTTPGGEQIEGGREARIIVRLPRMTKSLKVIIDVAATVKENLVRKVFGLSKKWSENDFKGFNEMEFDLTRGIKISYEDLHMKRFTPNFGEELLSRGSMSDEDKSSHISL